MFRRGVRTLVFAVAATVALSACSSKSEGQAQGGAPTTTSTSRPPFTGKTLGLGEVVKVDDLGGARMQPITGGDVRGPKIALKVLEFGTAEQIDDSNGGHRAPDGATLIAFRTSVTTEDDDLDEVVVNVSVDGTQRSLPNLVSSYGSGDKTSTVSYIVAVPEQRRTVDLELKSPGLVQQFDLLEGKPKGDRPAALYRPAEGTVIKQEALAPASFEVAPREGRFGPKQVVTVTEADFSYFNAKTGSVPSSPGKAWLTLIGTSRTSDANGVNCVTALSAHKLTDDKAVAYQPSDAGSVMPQESIVAEVNFTVSFEVPSDFGRGTLSIAPTQVSCQLSTSNYQAVPARGEAKVELTIPEK
jgi:hypothetical protein